VVQPGTDAFLHCQAYGNPRPRVAWSRDGYDVSRDPRFTVYPNGTLIIQRTLEQDMGSYLCVASNGVSSPAQRIVKLQLRGRSCLYIHPYCFHIITAVSSFLLMTELIKLLQNVTKTCLSVRCKRRSRIFFSA
jgi:hypothetical protein